MADKAISDLIQALQITNEDQFVLEQGGMAKRLNGETLLKFVTLSVVSVTVTTLPAGSSATATYDKSTGTLALGIPQGSKGDTGATGATGPANVLTIGSVTSGKVASATITGEAPNQVLNLVLEKGDKGETGDKGATGDTGPQGKQGIQGPQGKPGADAPTITGITIRQSDYHLIVTLSDGTTYDAGYCRGQAGAGTGDMLASVYDPQGKHQDVFKYVDDEIAKIPTPDVSAQIKAHNESATAHPDIRNKIPTKTSQLDNDSGFLTQHQDISGKLDKTGDGSNVTAAFTAATTRANIATGEKLSVLFGKVAKWFADLGSLAFKSTVAKSDLASDVQTSLGKADSALQSYKETDPTVPAWAKAKTKPSYSKSEVGLANVDNVKQYSASNPPPYPVTSVNGKTGAVTVPTVSVPSTSAILKGNGSGGIVAATRGSDYIASGNIVKQTLVNVETTPTENYAINWLFG
nr:MAG TPA: nucleoid-associated protein [Bacteriophage sp.]